MDKFWEKFTPANWTQIILILVAIIGGYFKFDARLTVVENVATSLSNKVEAIDKNGTEKSKEQLAKDERINSALASLQVSDRRITTLEDQMRQLIPKIERIDTNTEWLAATIRGKK